MSLQFLHGLIDQGDRIAGCDAQGHRVGFHLADIEQVVNHQGQIVSRPGAHPQVAGALFIRTGVVVANICREHMIPVSRLRMSWTIICVSWSRRFSTSWSRQ